MTTPRSAQSKDTGVELKSTGTIGNTSDTTVVNTSVYCPTAGFIDVAVMAELFKVGSLGGALSCIKVEIDGVIQLPLGWIQQGYQSGTYRIGGGSSVNRKAVAAGTRTVKVILKDYAGDCSYTTDGWARFSAS